MIAHLRFHGRGGEGVKLASRIVSRAAFLAGSTVQDSPVFGAERRGAPVVAFTRIAPPGVPITERGWVERPDAVLVMDDSLFGQPEAGVLEGVDAATLVLANSQEPAETLRTRFGIAGPMTTLDVSQIALAVIGRHVLSAPIAGATVKATGVASWEDLGRAVAIELGDAGIHGDELARNLVATRRAFDATDLALLAARGAAPPAVVAARFVVPRLPARVAAPSLIAGATSARHTTEAWRVERPVIDLARCTRCFLCFALCPEGAIHLDAADYPVVDYAHCKGCLVCVTECPPHVIAAVRETNA